MASAAMVPAPVRRIAPSIENPDIIRSPSPKKHPVWTHELVFGLAQVRCAYCHGVGLNRLGRPCPCVLRAIFRICAKKYLSARDEAGRFSRVTYDLVTRNPAASMRASRKTYSFKAVEYVADFDIIARRVLTERQLRILYEHILGDWRARELAPKLGLDRGRFFHEVYRIMANLGRAFAETRPYPLYPVGSYFS